MKLWLNEGGMQRVAMDDGMWFHWTGVLGMNDTECVTVRSWNTDVMRMIAA